MFYKTIFYMLYKTLFNTMMFYTLLYDHLILHWSLFLITISIDFYIFLINQWNKYKLLESNYPVGLKQTIINVLYNEVFILVPSLYLFSAIMKDDKEFLEGELIIIDNLYKIPIVFIVMDFLFYFMHRLFHSKYLYKYHSIHHQLTGPNTASTFYCHPLEMLFVNILPLLLSILICRVNFLTARFIHFVSVSNTMIVAHGGYKYFNNNSHDLHHKYRNCNYGLLITDRLFDTNL
jgi:sterol desaturase/sphingolipid hydroxylase (fatty acid hydroxylase superfamily)